MKIEEFKWKITLRKYTPCDDAKGWSDPEEITLTGKEVIPFINLIEWGEPNNIAITIEGYSEKQNGFVYKYDKTYYNAHRWILKSLQEKYLVAME